MNISKFLIGHIIKSGSLIITLVEDEHNVGNGSHMAEGLGNDGCTYDVIWSRFDSSKRTIDWDNPELNKTSDNE